MIAPAGIAHWRTQVPWTTPENVEQDLVLSRLIIEFANHPLVGQDLVFRGGTCFHKLWLDRPWRYSEDLDYVRRSEGGVGDVLDAIREVAQRVGFDDVRTEIGRHPKARLRSTFLGGQRLQIKVEMNTFERSPAKPTISRAFTVASPWFEGTADVPTFAIEELNATKIRALFQRSKSRDLFDLWLAIEHARISPTAIAQCFGNRPGPNVTDVVENSSEEKPSADKHIASRFIDTRKPATCGNTSQNWYKTDVEGDLNLRGWCSVEAVKFSLNAIPCQRTAS